MKNQHDPAGQEGSSVAVFPEESEVWDVSDNTAPNQLHHGGTRLLHKCLQRVVSSRLSRYRACSIIRDPFHPQHTLFSPPVLGQGVREDEEQDLQADG